MTPASLFALLAGATEPDYALFITHTREPPPAIVVCAPPTKNVKIQYSVQLACRPSHNGQCDAAATAMVCACDPFVVLCLISNILGDQNALFVSPQKRTAVHHTPTTTTPHLRSLTPPRAVQLRARELTGVCLGKTNNGAFIISELTNKWRGVSENLLHLRRFIVCACFCDVMI